MPKKYKHMPLGLQLHVLRKNLAKLNPWLEDVDLVPHVSIGGTLNPEEEWEDYVDPDASFPENLDDLERQFPSVKWRVPKITENKPLRMKPIVLRDEEGVSLQYKFIIKPHRPTAKGKRYNRGRIQISLDKSLIGRFAIVQIYVPKHHFDTEGMWRVRAMHYVYQHEWQWRKLFENRNVRPKKRKDVIPNEEGVLIRTEVIIKGQPVRAKGKTYNHGRIQISLDENLVYDYALVQVYVPKHPIDEPGSPDPKLTKVQYHYDNERTKLLESEEDRNIRVRKEIAEKIRLQKQLSRGRKKSI
jgi:hypothetical protein